MPPQSTSIQVREVLSEGMQGLTVGSLIAASRVAIENLLSFYTGNQPGGTPGIFDIANWYWWMGGAAWNVLPEQPFPTCPPNPSVESDLTTFTRL